jgi:hypothetical protein
VEKYKICNTYVFGITESQEENVSLKTVFKSIVAKNVSNLMKDISPLIQHLANSKQNELKEIYAITNHTKL